MRSLKREITGSAAVEFALIAPVFLILLTGFIAYGIYFAAASSLQEVTADAARRAVTGLDTSERQQLATTYVTTNAGKYTFLDPQKITLDFTGASAGQFAVALTLDARSLPIWNLFARVPLPSDTIVKRATIRVGGRLIDMTKDKARRFFASRSGNVAIMSAVLIPVAILFAAIVIDQGTLFTQDRQLQARADLAAISAATDLPRAPSVAALSLQENGVVHVAVVPAGGPLDAPPPGTVAAKVETGRYTPSAGSAVADRFLTGASPSNAVRVTLRGFGSHSFRNGVVADPLLGAQAVANVENAAAVSVGSRLLSLEGGIANDLLGALLGGSISLSAMDYEALLKTDVKITKLLDTLATQLHLQAVTYSDVLDASITPGQLARGIAGVDTTTASARTPLLAMANAATAPAVKLSRLIDLGPVGKLALGDTSGLSSAQVQALSLLTADAALANGQKQIAFGSGLNLLGVAKASLQLAVGEPPQMSWFAAGEPGVAARTAQTRLLLSIDITPANAALGAAIRVPVYIEVAYAEASITEIECGQATSPTVSVLAKPGLASLSVAGIDSTKFAQFGQSPVTGAASLVDLAGVKVTGSSTVEITNTAATKLIFSKTDIKDGRVRKAGTHDLATTAVASLITGVNPAVTVGPLSIGLGPILKTSVVQSLAGATGSIDRIVQGVLALLGVGLGEADVTVPAASCGRPVLVQ